MSFSCVQILVKFPNSRTLKAYNKHCSGIEGECRLKFINRLLQLWKQVVEVWKSASHLLPHTYHSRLGAGEAPLARLLSFCLSPWHVKDMWLRLPRILHYVKCLLIIKRLGHWSQSHSQSGVSACGGPTLVLAPCDFIFSCLWGRAVSRSWSWHRPQSFLIGALNTSWLLDYWLPNSGGKMLSGDVFYFFEAVWLWLCPSPMIVTLSLLCEL